VELSEERFEGPASQLPFEVGCEVLVLGHGEIALQQGEDYHILEHTGGTGVIEEIMESSSAPTIYSVRFGPDMANKGYYADEIVRISN
jgi:hypothetical protein